MISDERLDELDRGAWYDDSEVASLISELRAARAYIRELERARDKLIDTLHDRDIECRNLEQTARTYADEIRGLKADRAQFGNACEVYANDLAEAEITIKALEERIKTTEKSTNAVANKYALQARELTEALRWIWAFMYWIDKHGVVYPDDNLTGDGHDGIRQILTAVGLPAPEQK